MKLLGILALGLSAALLAALVRRTWAGAETGSMCADGCWLTDGVKGEGGLMALPAEVADVARRRDLVRSTYVLSRDLNIRYETYQFWRDGSYLGQWRVGAARYFAIVGSIASIPLLIWAFLLMLVSFRRKPKRLEPGI